MATTRSSSPRTTSRPARSGGESSLPRQIQPLKGKSGHIKMMLYGDPGAGKSRLVSTSPDALVLVNNPDETVSAVAGSTAQMWHVNEISDLNDAWEFLRHGGHEKFKWVWLDNLTLFQEQNMDVIMDEVVAAKPHRNRFVPDKQEYLVNQNQISLFVRNLVSLPMHVGVTAHVMLVEDDDGRVTYMPAVQGGRGALSSKICGYMNVVAYMASRRKDGKNKRVLFTDKNGKIYAKDRFDALGRTVEDPTIPMIMEKIHGKVTK